jgi:hypothetical protein
MKSLLALLATLVLAFAPARLAHATSSLLFDGDGYSLNLEIGYDKRPVIGSVFIYQPGDKGRLVPRQRVRVEEFDTQRKRLKLHYTATDEAPGIPSFTLVMTGTEATLMVEGRRIVSEANWAM